MGVVVGSVKVDDDGKLRMKRSAARHAGELNPFGPEAPGGKGNYPQRQNVARANNDRPLISPTFYLRSTEAFN
ncbi:hypothetical protein CBS63078_2044 [Aspergillus niger]|nr:hypothetical protein CBS115989_2031 [Aspergillus niger]KAI2850270.1 hypothetical protein CBS11350_1572 [Aspergillus niger]KAI2859847.1 hypothetical protein CBS11232_1776 [Aspergillus niger]KAI2871586.1 hypothetical protein CBS115988_8464 [Aspergillus niger]KAI2904613.1 hypothetical protein CBS13152_645 [Aspergillus niger]